MRFTADGGREIAKLDGQVWYGSDEDSVAFLQIDGGFGKGDRLVVVDRKTEAVLTDKILEGVHSWQLKRSVAETVAVRSKDSTVYFQSFAKAGSNQTQFGYSEANWRTGESHPVPSSPAGVNSTSLIGLPSGFAAVGFGRGIALYNETSRTEIPMPTVGDGYQGWVDRRVYYVQTIGLMEYYKGKHRQLTDTNLATTLTEPIEFASADVTSKVFAREINGKPCLIWGEKKEPTPAGTSAHGITEIVMVDAATGKEFLRKPLNFPSQIQPDRTGGRVYFIDSATGEIFYLDRETKTITSFAKTGLQNFGGWYSAIVAAN